ncbi:4'-phosphopantetheinyl transferase family protein [Roseibium sp.]|uniref:4'-phosphopantetheinyl transferase family protein n=1 Tax=Roseibium sp. TaxID=1936156 RepID=UPI003BAEC6DB
MIAASITDANTADLLASKLTSTLERERADRFRLEQNRLEHLLGRSILRRVLGDMLKLPPGAVPIETNAQGKPYIDGQACQFNLTHSNGWVAAAFCMGRRIGVDIEATGRIDASEAANLSRLTLSQAEQRLLLSAPADVRVDLFLRLWRMKEAVLKAEGCGLIDDLPGLDLAHLMLRPQGEVRFGDASWSVSEERPENLPPLAIAIETSQDT